MYDEAINFYVGREATPGVDYLIQDDGNGVYFKFWNVPDTVQPTIQQVESIMSMISFAIEFRDIRDRATEAQIAKQKEPMLLADKFVLDCSDATVDLLIKAQIALKGSGQVSFQVLDYQGNPGEMTLDDLDTIMGSAEKGIIGQVSLRRIDLQNQEAEILKKALAGQPYTVEYN